MVEKLKAIGERTGLQLGSVMVVIAATWHLSGRMTVIETKLDRVTRDVESVEDIKQRVTRLEDWYHLQKRGNP